VMINPSADRKPQDFAWLTESKLWKSTIITNLCTE
jgi:hypothetical protein